MAERDRPLTFGRPHPSDDRLQPDPVLVGGPDLDQLVRVLSSRLSDGLLQLFLNASRSSGVAAAGWRGRGFCTDQPIAFRASQPRCGATWVRPNSEAIQVATFGLGFSEVDDVLTGPAGDLQHQPARGQNTPQ